MNAKRNASFLLVGFIAGIAVCLLTGQAGQRPTTNGNGNVGRYWPTSTPAGLCITDTTTGTTKLIPAQAMRYDQNSVPSASEGMLLGRPFSP